MSPEPLPEWVRTDGQLAENGCIVVLLEGYLDTEQGLQGHPVQLVESGNFDGGPRSSQGIG